MNNKRFLSFVLDVAEELITCGAEVYRAEDTAKRICDAFGCSRAEIFVITSCVIITIEKDGESYTESRRISSFSTDFSKLDRINDMSRWICENHPSLEESIERFNQVKAVKRYDDKMVILSYMIISSSFTVFFGGGFKEAVVGALVSIIIFFLNKLSKRLETSNVIYTFFTSFIAGAITLTAALAMPELLTDKIMIGNVMILIPGVQFTNAIRDMLGGDLMSGILRLLDALVIGAMVAVGFASAIILFNQFI